MGKRKKTALNGEKLKPGRESWVSSSARRLFEKHREEWHTASEKGQEAAGRFYDKMTRLYFTMMQEEAGSPDAPIPEGNPAPANPDEDEPRDIVGSSSANEGGALPLSGPDRIPAPAASAEDESHGAAGASSAGEAGALPPPPAGTGDNGAGKEEVDVATFKGTRKVSFKYILQVKTGD